MGQALRITGETFNRLTAQFRVGTTKDNKAIWQFACRCGNLTNVIAKDAKSGHIKSCGCLDSERTTQRNRDNATHGMKGTPEYQAWASMKNRCHNKKDRVYQDYGARGISVCDRWLECFENFYADMGPRPEGYTKGGRPEFSLDRWPNNDGNYEPGNCRWATAKQQNGNRRKFKSVGKHSVVDLFNALTQKSQGVVS